jgi:secreted trypsin-like serine protease
MGARMRPPGAAHEELGPAAATVQTDVVRALSLLAISCLIVVALACAPDPPTVSTGSVSEPITNGTSDASDPAVVALVDATGTTLCTGTLIAPQVVITAAHCLEGMTTGIDDRVFFGSSVTTAGTFIAVSGVLVHPQFDPSSLSNDLALLALASAASATPVPMLAPVPDSTLVNAHVRIVGFGDTAGDAGDYGAKRSGTSTVASVTPTTMGLAPDPSQQCRGDSGGPALLTVGGVEHLAGVTSFGDTACVAGSTDTRVDAYLAPFIQPFVAACASQGCPTTCLPVGDSCPSGMQCVALDGGIAFTCQPTPATGKPSSGASCSSTCRQSTGSSGAWLSLVLGVGLLALCRRAGMR